VLCVADVEVVSAVLVAFSSVVEAVVLACLALYVPFLTEAGGSVGTDSRSPGKIRSGLLISDLLTS
jgi:hypothetical protein